MDEARNKQTPRRDENKEALTESATGLGGISSRFGHRVIPGDRDSTLRLLEFEGSRALVIR